MINQLLDEQTQDEVPLLPYGEQLRLLLIGSNLSSTDIRFVLAQRGIFVKDGRRENTIPFLANVLLSPREFQILKNKQQFKENTIKISDAITAWESNKTVQQALPDEVEPFVKQLVSENAPYQLTNCSLQINNPDEVVINISTKRQNWTKDAFSSTSYHDGKLIISRASNDILTYRIESTSAETKHLLSKLQNATHRTFQHQGVVSEESKIQKVMSNYFLRNAFIFEFLRSFIQPAYPSMVFQRISDIDAGVDQTLSTFPQNFDWLKDNINKISLHGERIHSTDVMKLGEQGILVFGEIEADFKFDSPEAKGACTIRYGFPKYYEKRANIEFEAKIANLSFAAGSAHLSKDRVSRYLIQEFQSNKHLIFENFMDQGKVNTQKRSADNQYEFEGMGWE